MSLARPKKKKGGPVISDYRELVDRLRLGAGRVAEHLRHMNHGPRWEALYERMLAW
jgi:hypothetical protein